jgi:transposase
VDGLIVWNLLSDTGASYYDLGHGSYQARADSRHRERDLIRRLERLTGKTVTLQPGPGEQPAA